ncbi:hypothetical protein F5B19DRAFT_496850 [Rostrohypoxylon terebratum]|nr:hypothetical protein F5B19DRAFT_496850 [Rostrohypoxylon terebratum]
MRLFAKDFSDVDPAFSTVTGRLLCQKPSKALDTITAKVAASEAKTDYLQASLDRAKPKKRRKVLPDPNKALMDIEDIMRAKAQMKRGQGDDADTVHDSARELDQSESESSDKGP